MIAYFPVYRTYLQPGQAVSDRDRNYIEQAVARARRRNPTIDATVFAFVQDALLLHCPEEITPLDRAQREAFVVRFQQTTGPVQAKSLEDTAFYRQVKLASLNEVGADPSRFGSSPSIFHALNSERLPQWPGGLSTTATHDTKRGEDARIRINLITELSDEWRTRLVRWSRWNARKKVETSAGIAPDPREEYLLYQTLLGAWPFGGPDDAPPEGFVARIQQFMTKALREAKLNTSWTETDSTYVDSVCRFVAEILEGPDASLFLKDFLPFQRRVARIGVIHSLAQTLLKLTSPGIPDIYQGCELWDLSLVDPDNRRPVDFTARAECLSDLRKQLAAGTSRSDLAVRLLAAPDDGAIKLYVIWTVLNHRKNCLDLYARGTYRALEADGYRAAHLVAFSRQSEGHSILTVVPRLVAGLMGADSQSSPIGSQTWGDSRLTLPDAGSTRWLNALSGEIVSARQIEGRTCLDLADVFRTIPLALLIQEPSGSEAAPR